jgi:copper chaperone CopZ
MKPVGPILVLLAALVLGWVALATDTPTYGSEPVREAPETVPVALSHDVPEGHVVRSFDVDGICCAGCAGKLFVAVDDVAGVFETAVDPERKRVDAVVPESFDVAVLEAALTFDKYSAHLHAAAE